MLTACTVDHLAEIVEQYRRRPFVPEEQWAGKVCRALEHNGGPLSLTELLEVSGLSEEQVDRGVDWHNARARELQRRFGGPTG